MAPRWGGSASPWATMTPAPSQIPAEKSRLLLTTIEREVLNMDLLPTLCSLAGLPIPEHLSDRPLLHEDQPAEPTFAQTLHGFDHDIEGFAFDQLRSALPRAGDRAITADSIQTFGNRLSVCFVIINDQHTNRNSRQVGRLAVTAIHLFILRRQPCRPQRATAGSPARHATLT